MTAAAGSARAQATTRGSQPQKRLSGPNERAINGSSERVRGRKRSRSGSSSGSGSSRDKRDRSDRNIRRVVLGDLLFETWYGSFYPDELVGGAKSPVDRLYVCRWCFRYSKELMPYLGHVTTDWRGAVKKLCPGRDEQPPGRLVYQHDAYSVYEVDGEEHKLYCQNLSLFAKLFLDNKSVCYDLTAFKYFLLARSVDEHLTSPRQVVGFFSKEKISWDNNNLACILVFPPWQRKGLGKILMSVSYELSKREGRIGGPEKPLSSLGKRGYLSFWSATVARAIIKSLTKKPITVQSLSQETYILPDDIISALKGMSVLNRRKRSPETVAVSKKQILEWSESNHIDLTPTIDESGFAEDAVEVTNGDRDRDTMQQD